MANLNLGQAVANNKKKENKQPNLFPYSKLWENIVSVLLLTSTPLGQISSFFPMTVEKARLG